MSQYFELVHLTKPYQIFPLFLSIISFILTFVFLYHICYQYNFSPVLSCVRALTIFLFVLVLHYYCKVVINSHQFPAYHLHYQSLSLPIRSLLVECPPPIHIFYSYSSSSESTISNHTRTLINVLYWTTSKVMEKIIYIVDYINHCSKMQQFDRKDFQFLFEFSVYLFEL